MIHLGSFNLSPGARINLNSYNEERLTEDKFLTIKNLIVIRDLLHQNNILLTSRYGYYLLEFNNRIYNIGIISSRIFNGTEKAIFGVENFTKSYDSTEYDYSNRRPYIPENQNDNLGFLHHFNNVNFIFYVCFQYNVNKIYILPCFNEIRSYLLSIYNASPHEKIISNHFHIDDKINTRHSPDYDCRFISIPFFELDKFINVNYNHEILTIDINMH